MISEIELTNFKSHTHSKLQLKKYNIFIGKNNTGKSSIGDALKIIKQFNVNQSLNHGPLINIPVKEIKQFINKGKQRSKLDARINVKGKIKWNWLLDPDISDGNNFELSILINQKKIFRNVNFDVFENSQASYSNDYLFNGGRNKPSGNLLFEGRLIQFQKPYLFITESNQEDQCMVFL